LLRRTAAVAPSSTPGRSCDWPVQPVSRSTPGFATYASAAGIGLGSTQLPPEVGVAVGVEPFGVDVFVAVAVAPFGVEVRVGVAVRSTDGVTVGVAVATGPPGVAVAVRVGVTVGAAGFRSAGTQSSIGFFASILSGPNWWFTKSPVTATNFGKLDCFTW